MADAINNRGGKACFVSLFFSAYCTKIMVDNALVMGESG